MISNALQVHHSWLALPMPAVGVYQSQTPTPTNPPMYRRYTQNPTPHRATLSRCKRRIQQTAALQRQKHPGKRSSALQTSCAAVVNRVGLCIVAHRSRVPNMLCSQRNQRVIIDCPSLIAAFCILTQLSLHCLTLLMWNR